MDAITMLIADDELLVRKGIRHILTDQPDYEVIAEASNGMEAVELAHEYKPKIVLMDVKMPVLDGLQALKRIRELKLSVNPVILSGYSDFAYAQKALKLGVYEYILKPADPEELLRVLEGLKQLILQNKEQKNNESKLKTQLSYSMPAFTEKFYRRLLEEEYLAPEIEEKVKILEIRQDNASVLLLSPDNLYQLRIVNNKEQYLELYNRIRSYLHEFIENEGPENMPVLQTDEDYFILILYSSAKVDAVQFAARLKAWIGEKTGITFSIAIGTEQSFLNLGVSYRVAVSRLKQRPVIGRDAVIDNDYSHKEYASDDDYPADIESKLESAVKAGDNGLAQHYITQLFDKIATVGNFTPDNWSHLCFDLLEMGYRVVKEFNIVRLISVADKVSEIAVLTTKTDIRVWMSNYISEIIDKINEVNAGSSWEVKKALSYIDEKFAENLGLATVADYVGLSPNYLSQMFKRSTGKTFLEHLTHCRLKEAKKLLKQPGLNIAEVSFRVGYDNQRYFSQVFIKQEGMTPSEYRKKIR